MSASSDRPAVRRVWCAVLVIACLMVAQGSGCDDGDDITVIGGGSTLIESLFPGTPVADNNKGSDGLSLSHPELVLNQGYAVFRNASNGTAILLYTDRRERLWAHYFDGSGFTPPVEIRGANQLDVDDDLGVVTENTDDDHVTWQTYQVLFLNTAGHANPNAAARNGDALIIWVKSDLEPPPGADPGADANHRLYGTYFDASLAETAASGDVRFGFDTTATPIDFDNQDPANEDENVNVAGFVSDSLVRTHAYRVRANELDGVGDEMFLDEPVLSGDPTTFAYFVWRKNLEDGVNMTRSRLHQVAFDLNAATNDIPTEATLGAGVLPLPGGITIPDTFSVSGACVVHNGDLIWSSFTPTDEVLFLTRLGPGVPPATIELGATAGTGMRADLPSKQNVYGGDHGLLGLYAFFLQRPPGPGDQDLFIAKSDLDAPLSREAMDISAGVGDHNVSQFVGTRINRTADWIMSVHREAVGPQIAIARAVQTRRAGSGPRSLANSLSPLIQTPNPGPSSMHYVQLQSELADGTGDPACGVQANRNRMNYSFQVMNPIAIGNEQLLHNGVVFTADATGSAPPAAAAAVPVAGDSLIDEHDTSFSFLGDDLRTVVADLGVSSGAPALYYLRNANNPTDAAAPGAFTEIRVFGAPGVVGAVPVVIGTDGPLADFTINEPMFDSGEDPIDELNSAGAGFSRFLRVQTAPLNPDVAGSPNHAGTLTHVFFQEARGGGNSLWSLKTRALRKASFIEASPASFGAAHEPPAPTSPPIALDGSNTTPPWVFPTFHQDEQDVGVLGNMFVVQGSTVGVFFQSDTHFWYQEFDGSSWYVDAGVGDPQQIDNEYGADAFPGHDQMGFAFPAFSRTSCDNRIGTIACFLRNMPGDDRFVRRLFVRVIE